MMTIFEKMDLVKKVYRYSLHEMANLCDIGVSTISRIMSKKYMPSYSTILQISRGTNIPVEFLINDHYILDEAYILARKAMPATTETDFLISSSDSSMDPLDVEITNLLKDLKEEQKQCVMMLISAFLKDNAKIEELRRKD